MEHIVCDEHQIPCMLKTGVKDGPNLGKSFYICAVTSTERCGFVQEAKKVLPSYCTVHKEGRVELQRYVFYDSNKEKRIYYRCVDGRREKKNWCGHTVVEETEMPAVQPSGDPNHNSEENLAQVKMVGKSKSVQHQSKNTAKQPPHNSRATPDFASLSLQNRMKSVALDGNESLLVSPHSGQLKYRSEIGMDNKDSGNSSSESDSETDSESDCKIVSVVDTKPVPQTSNLEKGEKKERPAVPQLSTQSRGDITKSPPSEEGPKPPHRDGVKDGERGAESQKGIGQPIQTKVITVIPSNVGSNPDGVKPVVVKQAVQEAGIQKVVIDVRAELRKKVSLKAERVKQRESQVLILKSVNKKVLPDGGVKLEQKLANLTKEIEALDLEIKMYQKVVGQNQGAEQYLSILPNQSGGVKHDAVVKTTVSGQPLAAGTKQTLLTDHAQQLPAHVLQQMYAANPQLNSLYGGRMTAARLREVGSVTTEAIERLHKQLATMPAPESEIEDPKYLTVSLMSHQRQALAWLLWREEQHPPGGILADDMGLGKTLTMISLVLKDKLSRPKTEGRGESGWLSKDKRLEKMCKGVIQSNATLVVCPASLVHQWGKEVERRCRKKALKVIIYHGPNREQNVHVLAESDLVLTTYSIVGREVGAPPDAKNKQVTDMPVEDTSPDSSDSETSQPNLMRIGWRRVILDEGHNIKNHKSLTAMSVCRLRAGRRWTLTGTPIQNDLLDMYSLLRFLRCSPFDEFKVWKRQVDNKSSKGQQRLNSLVKTLLLRRTKDQTNTEGKKLVALPSKNTWTHELELSKGERKVYERIFQESKSTFQQYLDRAEEKQTEREHGGNRHRPPVTTENPWSGQDSLRPTAMGSGAGSKAMFQQKPGQPGGSQILLMLLRLRQCCSHPTLMKSALDSDALQEDDGIELDIVEQMRMMAMDEEETAEPTVKKTSQIFEADTESTKITALIEHMKDIRDKSAEGRPMKSVIVSQWTQMLTVVEQHLQGAGFRCATIKGNIPPKTRTDLVDAFNTDRKGPEVMLLSLRAGGVGLNLVGGNHLFLIDMHWNPALESQACDRIYRMGQTLDVHIHRFICKDTIEEKILKLQKRKTELAHSVLSGAKTSANKLTLQDLKMLFGLDQPQPTFKQVPQYGSAAAAITRT